MSFLNPTPEETEARFAALLASPIVAPPPDDGASAADLPLLLRLANARVEAEIRRATQSAGLDLTSPAVHALRQCRYVGKRVASLAEHLQVSRQAAFQVVTRLERAGLVERTPSRHGPLVELTDDGHAVVREVTAVLTEVMEVWLTQLRENRLRQLCADLELLAEPPGTRWRNLGG